LKDVIHIPSRPHVKLIAQTNRKFYKGLSAGENDVTDGIGNIVYTA